jgi:ParB/RepB/Spo0J family partition protein
MAEQSPATAQQQEPGVVLRTIPLSRIVIADRHNPRRRFGQADLDRLAHAMATRGFDHPILVRPAGEPDEHFELIDGERRVRAAQQAQITEIPVLVKTREEAPAAALVDAMLANDLGVRLDVLEEAHGFQRLITEGGLTRKGVAEAFKVPVERVRERLQILELPEALHDKVADATIPLRAVKALAALTKIHPELAAMAVKRVTGAPRHAWDAPWTWDDVADDPINVVAGRYDDDADELPDGVYLAGRGYPASRFELDTRALAQLDELCALLPGIEPAAFDVRLGREAVEQATALKAAHASKNGHATLITGADVARQLAGDHIDARLKTERANARREQAPGAGAAGTAEDATPQTEAERQASARREREEQRRRKDAARAANEVLGAALVKHLSKVKLDERVVKILTAAPLARDLDRIAMRGARLGFPGWVTLEPRKNGTVKADYLPAGEAEAKAREYLAGATSAADVAGRSLALVAMARWADESAVASSQATHYRLEFAGYGSADRGVPWRAEADDLLIELLLERLPHEATERIRQFKAEREQQRAEAEQRDRERDAQLASFAERAGAMTRVEREEEIRRLRREFGFDALPPSTAAPLLDLPEPAPAVQPEPAVDAGSEADGPGAGAAAIGTEAIAA